MECPCGKKRDVGPLPIYCPYEDCEKTGGQAVPIAKLAGRDGLLEVAYDGGRVFYFSFTRAREGRIEQLAVDSISQPDRGEVKVSFKGPETAGPLDFPLGNLIEAAAAGSERLEIS